MLLLAELLVKQAFPSRTVFLNPFFKIFCLFLVFFCILFRFGRFTKAGVPVLVTSMIVVTGYMWVVYVELKWGWGPNIHDD